MIRAILRTKLSRGSLCQAALVLNLNSMGALPQGGEHHPAMGFSVGGRTAGFVGAELMTLGTTSHPVVPAGDAVVGTGAIARSNTHAVLAGIKSRWVYLMAGTALVEEAVTTDQTFRRSRQGGIPVLHAGVTAPFEINDRCALQLGFGRLQRLAKGAPPSVTTQRYLEGSNNTRAGLALSESDQEEGYVAAPHGAATPLVLTAPITTLSLGIELKL